MSQIPEPIRKTDGVYYLIRYLSTSKTGLTVDEIVDDINRSEKTVRRYLEEIENNILDINLIKERGPDRKYRYKVENFAVPFGPLVFSAYEILALYFVRGFAHFKDFNFIHKHISAVFNTIELSSKEDKERTGDNFQERVSKLFILPKELGGKVYKDQIQLECIEMLINAALDHKVCEISYGAADNQNKYKVAPLHFFNYRDAIYLLSKNVELSDAYSKNYMTNLALHRIQDVKVLEDKFEYPKELDIKSHFKSNSFNFVDETHNIKLKFSEEIREYILEREWYPNQEIKTNLDGSVNLEFESDLNLIIISWIKSFGSLVEVLEPKKLRKKIIEDLETNLKQY